MYRAPEMVDLYMRRQLDEKVDIWVRQEAHRQPGASLPPSTVVREAAVDAPLLAGLSLRAWAASSSR